MEKIIAEIIKGESGKHYRNTPCTHGNLLWVTGENGFSTLQTPDGVDAYEAGFIRKVEGSTCCRYWACNQCGTVLSEPERRTPGTRSKPKIGWILEKD